MTAHRQRRHGTTHRRPPGSFRGAPDRYKGGDGERTNGTAATEHTAGAGAEDKRREGREGGERDTDGLAPGEWRRGTRQQAGSRERTKKKRYINI